MQRGEVWLINLDPTIGAEIMKTRPAVIVNDDSIGILPLRVIVPSLTGKIGMPSHRGWCAWRPIGQTIWRNCQRQTLSRYAR